MRSETPVHVLLVTFDGQGHVNPVLRLAKRLASKGLYVTFSCNKTIGHMIQNSSSTTTTNPDAPIKIGQGHLCFQFFSDGWPLNHPRHEDLATYMRQLETGGRESFIQLIQKQSELGRPVSCIINNPFVPWATDVAADIGIPCAVLWVQSCAVYSAYYHYFHKLVLFPTIENPQLSLDLPGLPTLDFDEIPTFLHPLDQGLACLKSVVLQQLEKLGKAFCVLVDSFEELEQEAITPMLSLSPIRPVGPLFKFKDGDGDDNIRGDLWSVAEECIEWLDGKPAGSVVYISFGSIVCLGRAQMEEMARGLLNSAQPFLWVVKPPIMETADIGELPDGFIKEAGDNGLVVNWCPQDRVLAHPSVACFVTHCGWNSSIEMLSSGVPVLTVPQWGDQVTNAKFLTEVYGVGVRLVRGHKGLETLSREEVERCIVEVTRGPKADEFKNNALKWKKVAEEAVGHGGSSQTNLQAFVDEIRNLSSR